MSSSPEYEVIIGLEVHVQLATETKLFCGCPTQFGAPANTQVCPVCLGLPGALPVMNRRAYDLSLVTALGLNCEIPRHTKWDRKQYYYPDLPKGYQISQYDLPMSQNGWLEISDPKGRFEPKRVRIIRAHLEEDAGKSMHDEVAGKADSRIDLNRTGTPLLEIVSEPDMRSPEEARAYLNELKLMLTYLGVSDCNMQEGSLRVDANINLHVVQDGQRTATPIVEVKNMNSFRAVERALAYEAERQRQRFEDTGEKLGDVPKQTRGWDDQAGVTKAQRSKEESSDYRYFPDPDLVPIEPTDEMLSAARGQLGELPAALRSRLASDYEISDYDADVLVNQGRPVVDYFVDVAEQSGNAKQASNWIQRDVLRFLKERNVGIEAFPVAAVELAGLLRAVAEGELDGSRAPDVFEQMLGHGETMEAAIAALGIRRLGADDLRALCLALLQANPQIVEDVRGGKEKAVGALIGQAKQKDSNANPNAVRTTCLALIAEGAV